MNPWERWVPPKPHYRVAFMCVPNLARVYWFEVRDGWMSPFARVTGGAS